MYILCIIMMLIAFWEIPKILRREDNKELGVFIFLWLFAGVYGSLILSKINLISPFQLIVKGIASL